MSEELTGKEAYEAKKSQKQAQRDAAARKRAGKKATKRVVWWVVVVLILAGLGYAVFLGIQSVGPEGVDFSREIPIQNREHIAVGEEHPGYNSNPPTSGWHYEQTAATGFREDPPADEHIVHNLEHGDIWISYKPDISSEVVAVLSELAGTKVIVTPREENETDIALAAWGRLDTFDLAGKTLDVSEVQRITDFITRYINQGPERVTTPSHLGV